MKPRETNAIRRRAAERAVRQSIQEGDDTATAIHRYVEAIEDERTRRVVPNRAERRRWR